MFLGLTTDQWADLALSIVIFIAILAVGRFLITILLHRLGRRLATRTRSKLDDAVLDAIGPPLFWLIVVLALSSCSKISSYFGIIPPHHNIGGQK